MHAAFPEKDWFIASSQRIMNSGLPRTAARADLSATIDRASRRR